MEIRTTTPQDLERVMEIYAYARAQMKRTGNPSQWGDTKPTRTQVETDIAQQQSFLVMQGQEICGVFAFLIAPDPTYAVIEDGAWLNDAPYGVIHRVASSGKCHGVMDAVLAYCQGQIDNLRIDTHQNNAIMQRILARHQFTRCGIIHIDDGTPRIAYQRIAPIKRTDIERK
jgi:hypothetical protein